MKGSLTLCNGKEGTSPSPTTLVTTTHATVVSNHGACTGDAGVVVRSHVPPNRLPVHAAGTTRDPRTRMLSLCVTTNIPRVVIDCVARKGTMAKPSTAASTIAPTIAPGVTTVPGPIPGVPMGPRCTPFHNPITVPLT